jgi:hypothetical protein
VQKLRTLKYSSPKVTLGGMFVDNYMVPVLFSLHKVNCIQIMHFRSDEKTTGVKIENKGDFRGSVPIFR